MQGLFKLGIVGTREQMEDFLKKIPENELLAGWVLEEEPAEAGSGLRTVEGYGVKPFLDRCKLVGENSGSGNISGLREMADEISRLAPELEVVLLTQSLDYDLEGNWGVYYSPAGAAEMLEEEGTLCRGEPGDRRPGDPGRRYEAFGGGNLGFLRRGRSGHPHWRLCPCPHCGAGRAGSLLCRPADLKNIGFRKRPLVF